MAPRRDAPSSGARKPPVRSDGRQPRRGGSVHAGASAGRPKTVHRARQATAKRVGARRAELSWKPRPHAARRRLVGLLAVLLLVFAAIAVRLVDLQGFGRARYARLGLDQRVRDVRLAAERGSIFDRYGHDLAVSVPQQTVFANPQVIDDPAGFAAKLSPVVGVDEATLRERLSKKSKGFVYVARKVDDPTVARVKALRLPGIDFVPESRRFYPDGQLAGTVLGFVGTDNNGLGGLESQFESQLSGKPGELAVELDPHGRVLPNGRRRVAPSQRGGDLVLTVDQSIQYQTEKVLADEVTTAKAKGGTAIVMDVKTGDILAMATVDGASAQQPAGPAPASERNRPLTDVYEPGSTNKVITVAGAIEDGKVTPDTWLETPNQLVIDKTPYKDEASHPPSMTVSDVVRVSSNVGTIQIARGLGRQRFDTFLRAFGFGSPTRLGFPGEAGGLLLPLSQYNATSMASMPIGNGLAVTAMQMLDVYSTLANDGATRPPRLVSGTVGPDGERHDEPSPPSRQVVSRTTAATMRMMLENVVESGTGTKAAIPGYRVAGKTGTARKPPYKKPPYQYFASFAGFAPADSPRLAAIVVLDEPQGTFFGGQVAAPAFARIMEYALRVERIPPRA